ncbi:hypothetical protein BH10ACT1_BH10ACT1_21170 [soil metagenome]
MSGGVRRPSRGWTLGIVAAVVVLGGGYLAWNGTAESFTGPDPTVSADGSCAGGAPSAVLAFDAETGSPRWSARVGEAWQLELAEGSVTTAGPSGLRTLDVADGRARWCSDDVPVVGVVAAGGTVISSGGNRVVGRRARDGSRLWSRSGEGDWIESDGTVAVLHEGFGGDRQLVRGLDPASGRQIWRYETPGTQIGLMPLAPFLRADGPGLTFVHDTIGVVAAGATGDGADAARWEAGLFRPIGVSGDRVVGGVAESFSDPLTRFTLEVRNVSTGAIAWRRSVPGFDSRVVGGTIVVVSSTDRRDAPEYDGTWNTTEAAVSPASSKSRTIATGYDPADGTELWQRRLPFAAQVHAIGDAAMVWIPADDGDSDSRLLALDAASGAVTWRATLSNPSRSRHYHLADQMDAAVYDEATGTVMVLVRAGEPYVHRD